MATRKEHAARPRRESLRKRLGLRVSRAIAARDDHCCVYCSATAEESGTHLHLDHLRTRSRGGADVARNLVTACRRCNSARQDMTVSEQEVEITPCPSCNGRGHVVQRWGGTYWLTYRGCGVCHTRFDIGEFRDENRAARQSDPC